MIYINITSFVLISSLKKYQSMIETHRLKNVAIFFQTISSFVLSRKIKFNIYLTARHFTEHETSMRCSSILMILFARVCFFLSIIMDWNLRGFKIIFSTTISHKFSKEKIIRKTIKRLRWVH